MRDTRELVSFHMPLIAWWAAISRRSLTVIQGISWAETTDASLARVPEALAGFGALEHAIASAKWVVANSEAAEKALEAALAPRGATLGDFNTYQRRLRHLRNDVLAHLDRDFFNGSPSPKS